MKKLILIGLLSIKSLFGIYLTEQQISNYKIAKSVSIEMSSKYIGYDFQRTLLAIMGKESSYGMIAVGDKYKDAYYYLHQGKRVYVHKSKVEKEKDGRLFTWYQKYVNKYYKKVYVEKGKLKPLSESSLGPFQMKLSTAKLVISEFPYLMKRYKHLIDEQRTVALINMLLSNVKFSSTLAYHYLVLCQKQAEKKGFSNSYQKAVSRYNGGWYNEEYLIGIRKRLKEVNHIEIKYFKSDTRLDS